ncbi:MAG: dienelactone hydrolase family protein [Methanococcaceae archaeon]
MKIRLILIIIFMAVNMINAKIHKEYKEYTEGGTKFKGYLVYDDAAKGKRPGVLIIHEWWGLNDYPKMRAEEIAKLGYVAFAADVYGNGKVAATQDEAGKLAGELRKDNELLRKRVAAGLDVLKHDSHVDASKISSIGYCFGGAAALELARSGADVKGTCVFHGNLKTANPNDAKNIKGKILILTGGDDNFIPPGEREDFQKEMNNAKVDWQMNIYSGAVHSFTNPKSGNDPSKGIAYNEKADKRSWEAMKSFFNEVFK